VLALLVRIAGFFGVSVTPIVFAAGVLGGVSAGVMSSVLTYKVGHYIGYELGAKTAEKQAEINELQSKLADAKRDMEIQADSAASARAQAVENQKAAQAAEEQYDAFAKKVAARGPAGACVPTDDDVAWVRDTDPGRTQRRRKNKAAPASR
jgi:hypothetical protein